MSRTGSRRARGLVGADDHRILRSDEHACRIAHCRRFTLRRGHAACLQEHAAGWRAPKRLQVDGPWRSRRTDREVSLLRETYRAAASISHPGSVQFVELRVIAGDGGAVGNGMHPVDERGPCLGVGQ